MSKIIVLIGAPGAGKGTQARLLQEGKGWPQISTGDMFRALKNATTPLAREVQGIMSRGELVSDELTNRIVAERIALPDCQGSYILDGYPRTTAQAECLEEFAREQGKTIQAVLVNVPLDILEQRLTGRRSCKVCGEIYNIYCKPPQITGFCDFHPEVALDHRKDDQSDVVHARLATYEAQTRPLLDYYAMTGRLATVDGMQSLLEVYAALEQILAD